MAQKSKMAKHLMLEKDPFIKRHLPDTQWYSKSILDRMLIKTPNVYIKPDGGKQGIGIVRVRRLVDNSFEISHQEGNLKASGEQLFSQLEKYMEDKKEYIIQEGIDLATYKGNPFDVRVVLQKPYNIWQVTLTSAKVAPFSDSVVTNVSRGAKDYLLHEILLKYDQGTNPISAMREIIDLSHRVATVLGRKMPLEILGLDLALDKKGEIWIIEANVHPACSQCKLVNDQISIRKYEEAKRTLNKFPPKRGNPKRTYPYKE